MINNGILKLIKDEFIYGSHLLSLGAAAIAFTSAFLLDIPITWDFLTIAYLIFYSIYSYNRYKEFKNDFSTNSARTSHIKNYFIYYPFIIFFSSALAVLILLRFGNIGSFIFGFFLLISGFLYTDYFKKITEKIVGFKNFYVAFVWALLVIILSLYYNVFSGLKLYLIFFFVFFRWILNTAFFDLKDIDSDKKENLKTIPVFWGKEKTLLFFHIINILSFIPITVGVYKNILPFYSLSLLIFYFYSFYYLQKAKDTKTDIHTLSYVMVDGEYLFWPIVLFLTKLIRL